MINLLTGKKIDPSHPVNLTAERAFVEEPFTAAAHLAAMRRLLHAASNDDNAYRLPKAARIHSEAAKTAPARTVPRDGDTL